LETGDALDYTRQRAQAYASLATQRVEQLPAGPARDILLTLAELVVTRND
jgi:geranylgeranyl pyrophosphate synthase